MELKNDNLESAKKSYLDRNICLGVTVRTVIEFIIVTMVLCVFGMVAFCQIKTELNERLAESVARNTKTIAYELNKNFDLEILLLTRKAELIESTEVSPEDFIKVWDSKWKKTGILSPMGEPYAGIVPPKEIFEVAWEVYENKKIIRYISNVGLIFAVPLHIDGKIYMLYEYYMDPAIRQQFSTISYSGDGTVILLNNKKDWTVIANGIPPLINTHPDMEAGWQKLSEQMGLRRDLLRI